MDPNRPPRDRTSPWMYVGCGCGIAVALVLAGLAAVTFFGYRKAKEVEQTFKDPEKRAAKTREILPYDELPRGYYPAGGVSVPLVMDMAMFSDKPPAPGSRPRGHEGGDLDFGEHGFIYMSFRSWMGNGKEHELRDYIEGKGARPKWMNRSNVDLEHRDILRRGQLEVNGRTLSYAAARGEVNRRGRHNRGLVTFFTLECPNDNRRRMGLWFGPDPAPDKPAVDVDLTGTTGDPEAIKAFVSHFRFCPAQP
jgi:hypothetical protein